MKRTPFLAEKPNGLLVELGAELCARRKALGTSATVVSEAAGISRGTLHRIEQGAPSVTMGAYQAVADAVGVALGVREKMIAKEALPLEDDWIPVVVRVEDYPQLASLAWHIGRNGTLTPREALNLYERGWRHVDEEALTAKEKIFISNLRRGLEGTTDV